MYLDDEFVCTLRFIFNLWIFLHFLNNQIVNVASAATYNFSEYTKCVVRTVRGVGCVGSMCVGGLRSYIGLIHETIM